MDRLGRSGGESRVGTPKRPDLGIAAGPSEGRRGRKPTKHRRGATRSQRPAPQKFRARGGRPERAGQGPRPGHRNGRTWDPPPGCPRSAAHWQRAATTEKGPQGRRLGAAAGRPEPRKVNAISLRTGCYRGASRIYRSCPPPQSRSRQSAQRTRRGNGRRAARAPLGSHWLCGGSLEDSTHGGLAAPRRQSLGL